MSRAVKERLWFVLSLGYAAIRVLGASAFLEKYGLNIVVFAIVEFVSSSFLAVASAHVVRNVVGGVDDALLSFGVDRRNDERRVARARRWVAVVVVCFAAPDVYAYLATDHLPPALIVLLVVALIVSALTSVIVIARRIRDARAEMTSPFSNQGITMSEITEPGNAVAEEPEVVPLDELRT